MTGAEVLRFEEGALDGWPALRTELRGGWALRFAQGYSKRANSVHPLYAPAPANREARIAECEDLYRRAGLPTVFKLPGHHAWEPLDAALDRRGYTVVDPTRVLTLDLGEGSLAVPPGTRITEAFEPAWFDAFALANNVAPEHRETAWTMARAVDRPLVATVDDGGRAAAWGYAAVVGDQAWLFDIVVAQAHRRRGLGSALVQNLVSAAREAGARTACLQVVAANQPANALYEGLGFAEAYRYWYRREP